jgi:hypothetical protein|tara:strand:+ start:15591 stop:19397 length:3807 start_codon:yes stop_codon:yes gene_type:complete
MSIIKTIQFRFKSPVVTATTPPSQSLFVNIDNDNDPQFTVVLEHTSSLASGSYSGSIPDPYSKYGTLKFTHEDIGTSASVYLPFLDGGWWSVMVAQSSNYTYTLYAANKLYNGVDGNTVGFKATNFLTGSFDWNNAGTVYFPGSGSATALSKTYTPFNGQLQELRYFTETVTDQQFDAYTQNPNSIEGSSNLNFRASLGGELFTKSSSIHPGVGGAVQSDSFSTGNTFTLISGSFGPNYETILIDQVEGGVRNRVANKIKKPALLLPFETSTFDNIPSNKVLSAQLRIQQNLQVSQSSTRDVNYVEATLSPQNEINDDINATYGYLNIGEYIGDPRQITSSLRDYPNLVGLKNSYFNKYSKNYNYKDYIRLSKYYDNAVFQMVKDFTPVRAGIATGVTVKQHLLERNRVRPAQITLRDETLSGSIKPQSRGYEPGTIEVFSGGPGGSVNSLTGSNQAWTASYSTLAGLVTQVESSQYEFYNGEYSGSSTTAQISHSINPDPILNNVGDNRSSTLFQDVDYSSDAKTPVNIDLILSGSAISAIVPDSNYTSLRSISPRYLGSKNSGELNLSQSFANNSIQEGYPVDRLTPWFAHFNGIYGSAELGIGIGGNINITQLINAETGDTITLTSENTNLDLIGYLFKKGDKPSIIPATTGEIIEGGVELEAVGQLYQTILMKSGSAGSGFQGTIYPNGALNSSYATSNPDTRGFYNGIAVTQSLDTPFFPNQASWFGYQKTIPGSTNVTASYNTVTATTNLPAYGLPPAYTTPGTQESSSLAANEIQVVTLTSVESGTTYPSASLTQFQEWKISSGSILDGTTDALLPSITTNPTNAGAATYTGVVTTTDGAGSGAEATVVVAGTTAPTITGITLTGVGSGYEVGDTLTIPAGELGAGQLITGNNVYSISNGSSYALGTVTGPFTVSATSGGASFTIQGNGTNVIALTVSSIGTGYTVGGTITISQANIRAAGFTGAVGDLTITPNITSYLQNSNIVEFTLQANDFWSPTPIQNSLPNIYNNNSSGDTIELYISASTSDIPSNPFPFALDYEKRIPVDQIVKTDNFEEGWLDLINSSRLNSFNFPGSMQSLGNVYIYNKVTNEFTQEVVSPREETYLPLQRGDFIRVGTTASIDTSFTVGTKQLAPLSVMRTTSYIPNSTAAVAITGIFDATGGIQEYTATFRKLGNSFDDSGFFYSAGLLSPLPEVEGLTDPVDYVKQSFRIIRRIPTEFYILAKNKPGKYTGEGLLLPINFDPQYDARAAAIKVGAISRTN